MLNLAAGLDRRPYRLPLPKTLRGVEADVPGIVDEKERALAAETAGFRPVIRLAQAWKYVSYMYRRLVRATTLGL